MSKLDLIDIEVCMFSAPEHTVDSAAEHDLHHVLPRISFIEDGQINSFGVSSKQMSVV
jgi:hypothetical protein